MQGRRRIAPGAAFLALLWALSTAAPGAPVAAECPFVPPFPTADDAIRSADEVLIGQIVTVDDAAELGLGLDQERTMALRVTEVLRGPRAGGDLVDVQYLQPNWPWGDRVGGTGEPYPSCSYLDFFVDPGDTIALALGAVQPRQRLEAEGISWIQSRTVYNAMRKIRDAGRLADLRYLAGLPQTDMVAAPTGAPSGRAGLPWLLILLAGVGAGAVSWHRAVRRA